MDIDSRRLRRALRKSGLSEHAINAAWPEWWSDDAEKSPSARAELCFAVARKLGLAPKPLYDEKVEFVWRDRARFKNGLPQSEPERDALSSFGVSVARLLLTMVEANAPTRVTAERLRKAILAHTPIVSFVDLISTCWALGIPVVHLRVFPLPTKSMSAMVVRCDGRFAILLGRDSFFPAPVSFTLAHEVGHIMLGHLADEGTSIVDLEEPGVSNADEDDEERSADAFALKLLTGREHLEIKVEGARVTSRALAAAVIVAGPPAGIEPGTLALCYAYQEKAWAVGMGSLKYIYPEARAVWQDVNNIAARHFDWSRISDDNADFIRALLERGNG